MFASHFWKGELAENTVREIQNHRFWYIFEGLLFLIVGILAMAMPGATAFAIEMILAAVFLVGGIIRFFNGLLVRQNRWWRLISGAIYAVAGAMVFAWPFTGLAALLMVVGALLLIEGIFDIGIALTLRPADSWGWVLAAGIASLVLGILIFVGFPAVGIVYLAIALGLSFAFYGISVLTLALRSKKPLQS